MARKLLLVTHYMPPHHGGIERIAEDHARTASAAGWEVTWVAGRIPRDRPRTERTDWGRAERIRCLNGLERRFGVPWPLWLPGPGLRALVREADLVHVHDLLYHGSTLALTDARRRRKPVLLTQHVGFVPYPGLVRNGIQRLAYRTLGRRNAALATAVACYNEGALAWLRRACAFKGPGIYLPNGVDGERFRPARDGEERRRLRERHGLPAGLPVVLFVGRLVAKKGAQLVVDAATPDHHLLLVGERGSVVLPGRPQVELRPFVSRETLAELLRAVDLLLLPSVGEGFPLVAQEAMASGLPVVLGRDPGYERQVDEGSVVFVEPERAAVRGAVGRLLREPEARSELGRRARRSALEHWAVSRCRERLLEVYTTLVEGGNPEALGP